MQSVGDCIRRTKIIETKKMGYKKLEKQNPEKKRMGFSYMKI